jgi:regulator of sigma E protease
LLIVAGLVMLFTRSSDPVGNLIAGGLVVVGLTAVIFIHELGHFLAAKWCDVHVQTFSIGFGPAIPGCRFRYGETSYKLAIIPLGGYVKMVGEGAEGGEPGDGDEAEDDPRSFKNKPVWQRMIIISAGVVMNLIMAAALFVFVFMTRGVERIPAVVGGVEPGSPAWQAGLTRGSVMRVVGRRTNPHFDDLRVQVATSRENRPLPFTFDEYGPDGSSRRTETEIQPVRSEEGLAPLIGVYSGWLPQMVRHRRYLKSPFTAGSAAARANPPLEFHDKIIAATDPADPSRVTPLAKDPRRPETDRLDFFDLQRRLLMLAGKPITVRVQRDGPNPSTFDVNVPASFYSTFGVRMRMGEVTAVRENSPAATAGVRPRKVKEKEPGDILTALELTDSSGKPVRFASAPGPNDRLLDPLRLPMELAAWAATKPANRSMKLTVLRPEGHQRQVPVDLNLTWDSSRDLPDDPPISNQDSPVTLSGLGLGYRVQAVIDAVIPGSPAETAGLKANDVINELEVTLTIDGEQRTVKRTVKDDQWAFYFHELQLANLVGPVKLTVNKDRVVEVTMIEDPTWPMVDRGFRFDADTQLQRATSLGDAVTLGFRETVETVSKIYRTLHSLLTRRISVKAMSGPINISKTAYQLADQDTYYFILFIAMISANLAVVNFLPIPVLDGGHMVFLIYEWLRGKPPTDRIRLWLTIAGLGIVLSLMGFTIFNDIRREFFSR